MNIPMSPMQGMPMGLDGSLPEVSLPSKGAANVYSDLQGLDELRKQAKTDEKGALKAAAKQLESVFMNLVLKSMREANDVFSDGNMFDSQQSKMFRSMYDEQLTLELSQGRGLGLADIIVKQLSPDVGARDIPKEQLNHEVTRQAVNPQYALQEKLAAEPQNGSRLDIESKSKHHADMALSPQECHLPPSAILAARSEKPAYASQPEIKVGKAGAVASEQVPELDFSSPTAFVKSLMPVAEKWAEQLNGLDPKALVAQAALETGWGKHIINKSDGQSSFNLFNIKADHRWGGDKASVQTLEYIQGNPIKQQANFRAYNDIEHSFSDYAQFIQNSARYAPALDKASDPTQYIEQLQQAGYATDPEYANKIKRIMASDLLNSN
jgi:flagellar protein FlgJ